MAHRDNKDLNEFSQKMRNEGAKGFGGGGWPETDKTELKPRHAAMHPGGARPVPPRKQAPCQLGDRILTGLAILSLGMLIVGAMGAYLSNDSQRVTTTAPDVSAPTSGFTESTGIRLNELERRMTALNDRYGQRLHALETQMVDVIEPYGARLKTIETRLATPGGIDMAHLRELEHRLDQFDASAYQARLKRVENRMAQEYPPGQAGLRNTESRPGENYAAYDSRLRAMETRMMQIQAPYEHRLQELEQRLIYAYARLDYLSARMESFISTNSALMQANATLYDNPPASAPVDNHTSPYAPPAPATEEPAAEAVTTPPDADAADTVALPAESPSSIMVSSVAPQAPTRQAGANSPTATPEGSPGETVVSAPTTQASMAATVSPRKHDKPAATTAVVRKGNSPNQPGAGGWAINLASYTNQEIAASKLADFKRKGVSAEQVEATVKGKTIYRVRVAGFDTRMAARAQAETIKRQLGLKETWITKQ